MTKVKDELARSLNKIKGENHRSIVWEAFLMNFLAIEIQLIASVLNIDVSIAELGSTGEKIGGGKAIDVDPTPYVEVLTMTDAIRGFSTLQNTKMFFDYFLESEVEDQGEWYTYENLRKAYEAYYKQMNSGGRK